ncbi:MFS transporter [Alicyclobacillus sp. SO9]|uniref:MDR family MFS transporter n=1 Tax=Alicyclobacillus sp. SO9 TaxID=2665646 RepID=UPI0018E76FE4|nr:MFS transporter [Alicyclobacillus sp. SO9]QQE79484.1 MFS transporter [Alicyclobacillus sp. SO9]
MGIRLKQIAAQYHPVVWWIVGATAVTRITQFMVMPFLALYMAVHTHAGTATIGLAIGMAALTSTVFGFIGGPFADKYGRKGIMVLAMIISAVALAGFANARVTWVFFVLSALNGLTRTLFGPASQAMLTDVTSPELRSNVFAMRYWAINVGASMGPVVGGYLGTVATGWTFYLAAAVSGLYGIVILLIFPESSKLGAERAERPVLMKTMQTMKTILGKYFHPVQSGKARRAEFKNRTAKKGANLPEITFRKALQTVFADKALLLFVLATIFSNIGYSQVESTLPQFMGQMFTSHLAARTYAWVLTSNAVEVVILQLPLTKITNKFGLIPSMVLGQVLFGIGYVGLGFSTGLWSFVASMLVVTMGEIIVFPRNSEYLSVLAPDNLRATYFGASTLRSIGFFLGPWIGGWMLGKAGGPAVFTVIAGVAAVAAPFYVWSNHVRHHVEKSTESMVL